MPNVVCMCTGQTVQRECAEGGMPTFCQTAAVNARECKSHCIPYASVIQRARSRTTFDSGPGCSPRSSRPLEVHLGKTNKTNRRIVMIVTLVVYVAEERRSRWRWTACRAHLRVDGPSGLVSWSPPRSQAGGDSAAHHAQRR